MDILNNFLHHEIMTKGLYEEMCHFIESYEIRRGEFECNIYIIVKIDRENFILYPEYEDKNGLSIPFARSIYKKELLDAINEYAKKKGII